MRKTLTLIILITSSLHATADAALLSRLGGAAVYDTVRNITWIADADLGLTNAFGAGVINLDGSMTWAPAQSWIAGMNQANYLGYNHWRLPATPQPDSSCTVQSGGGGYGYNCTSEMSALFFALGGVVGNTLAQVHNADYSLFSNIQTTPYWSTEYAYYTPFAWRVNVSTGYQDAYTKNSFAFALAVRAGDVVVPAPAAAWLFVTGMLAAASATRRRRKPA